MKIGILTIIIFLALDRIISPFLASAFPVSVVGAILSMIYWGILLLISYVLSNYLLKSLKK